METSTEPPSAKRGGRWKRRLAFTLAGLVLLGLLVPTLVAPLLRRVIERQIEERLDARAALKSFSFSWSGNARIGGLELTEPSGEPLASVEEIQASLGILALLGGDLRAEVDVRGPELHLRRDSDGRWNFERIVRASASEEQEEEGSAADEELPAVEARIALTSGRIVLHGNGSGGDTELTGIELGAQVDGLDHAAPFQLSFDVRGPDGPAGKVSLQGTVTAAADGRLGPEGLLADARLELQELDLRGLAPALALVAPVDGLSGIASGQAAFDLGRGLALQGSSEITLRELAFRGTRPGGPEVRIQALRLDAEATQASEGAGTQRLELRADDFLSLAYTGSSKLAPDGAGAVSGALTLEGSLGRLGEIAAAWVELQEGVRIEGRLSQEIDLAAELRSRQVTSLRLSAHGGLEGVGARDAQGQALALGELAKIALWLEASADLLRGDVHVGQLSVQAGPVTLEGHLDASGLLLGAAPPSPTQTGELSIRDGAFSLEADLGRLRASLGQLVDLGQTTFGGRLSAQAKLASQSGGLDLEGQIQARELSLAELSLASLDGELKGLRRMDGSLGGSASLQLEKLVLSTEAAALEIPGVSLGLLVNQDAAGKGEHSAQLQTSDGALQLVVQATSHFPPDADKDVVAAFKLDARLGRLAELARPWLALREGLAGDLHGQGEVSATLKGSTLAGAHSKVELFLSGLSLRDDQGQPIALGELSRGTLALEALLDPPQGALDLRSLSLSAGSVHVSGKGRAAGLPLGARAEKRSFELQDTQLELEADLGEVGAALGRIVDLGGVALGGQPVHGSLALSSREQRIEARGKLTGAELTLQRPEAAPIEQRDLALEFDLGFDPKAGTLDCRTLKLASETASAEISGALEALLDPAHAKGELKLACGGELTRILHDLGLETADSGRETSGQMKGTFRVTGDQGAFRVRGESTIEEFRLELAPASGAGAPLRIEDPKIALSCDANVTMEHLDLDLQSLRLGSSIAHGGLSGRISNLRALAGPQASSEIRFEGLAGELAYVPDRLGAVLAPWLPGTLSGSEEERITFQLDGRASELDLAGLLGGLSGRADLGLGHFVRPEIDLAGSLSLEMKEGRTLLRGDLRANGGKLGLDSSLDLAGSAGEERPRSTLKLAAQALRANSGLAPLLALLHPAFAGMQLAQGELDGLIDLSLDLSYDGPLTPEALADGWQTLPKEPINGTGRFELRSAAMRGSPILDLLQQFGVDAGRALDIRPIDFTIRKGRVSYAKPWTWTFSGVETSFSGSIGLDQTLALDWKVPVSDELVKRHDFLRYFRGETLQLPLRGTVLKPRLETSELFKDLAAQAAKRELESRLGLGGGKQDGSNDPAALLEQADKLWDQGKKTEAAALYLRLREEFKVSVVYLLNKDRIKERSKYK